MSGLEMKYFVLNPRGSTLYSQASREAMLTYADYIEGENEELANDLRYWVDKTTEENVSLDIELSDDDFYKLSLMAHERDITLNDLCNQLLLDFIEKNEENE